MNNFRDKFNSNDWKARVLTRARSTSNVWNFARDFRRPQLDSYYGFFYPPSLIEKARGRLSKSDSNLIVSEARDGNTAPICLEEPDDDLDEDIPIRPQRHKTSAVSHHNLQYYRNYRNRHSYGNSENVQLRPPVNSQGFGYGFDHWYTNNNMNEENVERRKNKSNEPRPSSSGFQSFLNLFKKPDQRQNRHEPSISDLPASTPISNSVEIVASHEESSSSSSSPTLELSDAEIRSSSSSESSLFSIATNGFSFIPVDIYQPDDDESVTPKEIVNGSMTDTYRQRVQQRDNARQSDILNDLTLRKKYKLFTTETIRGPEKKPKLAFEVPQLPSPGLPSGSQTDVLNHRKKRRSVSDCSKDRRSYVHVIGKRKAPQPPSPSNSSTNERTPRSTLGRKKRPAPPPPTRDESISTTSLLDDKDIRALIEGRAFNLSEPSGMKASTEPPPSPSPARKLTETQKEELLTKVVMAQERPSTSREEPSTSREEPSTSQQTSEPEEVELRDKRLPSFLAGDCLTLDKGVFKFCKPENKTVEPAPVEERPTTPVSPISPRPWFKRQSNSQTGVNPFKKDFFLKTVDRKQKKKLEDDLPEFSFCRNSLLEHSEKLSLLPTLRLRSPDRSAEKRRSGIGIPNISELDREAAEIVEQKNSAAEQLMKRQQMLSKKNSMEDDEPEQPRSTRDLISKFESSSNSTFQAKVKSPKANRKLLNTRVEVASTVFKSWICPYCTLENPSWKIVCLACEKLKPCENLRKHFGSTEKPSEPDEWEVKREKVLKYFQPTGGLSKSASETSIRGNESPRVPGSPAVQLRRIAMENAGKVTNGRGNEEHSFSAEVLQALNKRSPRTNRRVEPERITNEPSTSNYNGFRAVEVITAPLSPRSSALLNIFEPIDEPEPPNASPPKEIVAEPLNIFEPIDEPSYCKPMMNGFHEVIEPPKKTESLKSNKSTDRAANHVEIKYKDTIFARKEVMITNTEEEEKLKQKKEKLSNREELEREKERLREMIKTMNAKALNEAYPITEKREKLVSPIMEAKITLEPVTKEDPEPKLGAIKKLFKRDSKKDESPEPERPKKVSSSVQTPGILKKSEPEAPVVASKEVENVYENISDSALTVACITSKKEDDEKAKYRRQFKSSKGLDNFKASLKFPQLPLSSSNTLAINKLLRSLENAIGDGEFDQAAAFAMELAKMKVALSVTRQSRPLSGNWENITLTVNIEDKDKSLGPTNVTVSPLWTILQLKQRFNKDFGYPIASQSWIFHSTLMVDNNLTLLDYKIMESTDVYLYLADPDVVVEAPLAKVAELDEITMTKTMEFEREIKKFEEEVAKSPPRKVSEVPSSSLVLTPQGNESFKVEPPKTPTFTSADANILDVSDTEPQPPPPEPPQRSTKLVRPTPAVRSQVSTATSTVKEPRIEQTIEKIDALQQQLAPKKPGPLWTCSICTLINTHAGDECAACGHKRANPIPKPPRDLSAKDMKVVPQNHPIVMTAMVNPNITKSKYRGVDNYNPAALVFPTVAEALNSKTPIIKTVMMKNPDKFELAGGSRTSSTRKKKQAPLPPGLDGSTYLQLLNLDSVGFVGNLEPFECSICFVDYERGEGAVLRDCLHTFCRECLARTVEYSEDPEVKCPYIDADYSCDSILQEREVRALVNQELYEKHLTKSIRLAENQIENAFHCKTPNCRGWCIYEDNVNTFRCPVCRILNCLTCRAIHDGLNCKQYQERLKNNCDNNVEARRTIEFLQEMVEKGEAINCPTCQVIVMKKWGCDWLKCSICKTEICWITRGPRWGQGGKGDTTGGCKCGVNGVKCHPKCNYCH